MNSRTLSNNLGKIDFKIIFNWDDSDINNEIVTGYDIYIKLKEYFNWLDNSSAIERISEDIIEQTNQWKSNTV